MISYQNCEIFASIAFYLLIKIFCYAAKNYDSMRRTALSSIPEKNENEEESRANKWVPKKKHEVLKAKYKCLKKLFQIYDASVIGILPETYPDHGDAYSVQETEEAPKHSRRKKRSHRTKTDACAGTTEISSGDVTNPLESEQCSTIATAVIRDLNMNQCSCVSTEVVKSKSSISEDKFARDATNESSASSVRECECTQTLQVPQHPLPYLSFNERHKPTRFQCLLQRIFGLRCDRRYKNYVLPNGHVYAASDNNIYHYEKRRRRGLRFRRLRRPKKIQSEIALRDLKNPVILTYVQSVQRNCLMDTTARQCPIMGCKMMFYGIINYNDHLNLCHFTERKYVCHYCHEGFEKEYDKYVHENEHIGITKLNITSSPSTARPSAKKVSNTQTDPQISSCDVPEEKLKKIVSFFDKISDPDSILSEIRRNRYSESNLQTLQRSSKTETAADTSGDTNSTSDSDKRTVSCVNLQRRLNTNKCVSSIDSDVTSKQPYVPVTCHFCGESFQCRRQLCLHVDLEHRVHNKYSKFHSCMGITGPRNRLDMVSEGNINVQSIASETSSLHRVNTSSTLTQGTFSEVTRRKSDESISCDPSTNIIYYTSMESLTKKSSKINSLMQKVKNGIGSYKWEPGTKIIRV